MSHFIRNLRRTALVLPVLLLSAQLTFASDAKTTANGTVQKQQPAPTKVTKENTLGLTISKSKPGSGTGTRGGTRNYVYFNVNNFSSYAYTEVYFRPKNSLNWIAYVPADGVLLPGDTQIFTIPNRNTCYYDILLRNGVGDSAVGNGVNFCRVDDYNIRD